MKPILSKKRKDFEKCEPASCPKCKTCRVVNIEERKVSAPQLYAREAENYFFYYALNMKQTS